jgi:tetratricopeptide (TPR) repeat protein
MFAVVAAAFIISFVILGVGSGSTGISSVLSNLLSGSTASGSSLAALKEQTVKHPKSATAWLNYANKLEQAQQDDNAIAALTQYTTLRPKDQNALEELAGLYLSRATAWNTLYGNAQALTEALTPTPFVSPSTSSSLGKGIAALPADPVSAAVTSELGTETDNDYSKIIGYLTSRVGVYQKLAGLNPDDAYTQYSLAQAAQDAGNAPVAIKAYEKFLKLAPNDSLAPTARSAITQLKASES